MKLDPQGRGIMTMHDVRGALVTASVAVSTGTASALVSGDADYFLDLIEVTFANNSTAAASVSLVNDGTTIRTFQVPAATTFAFEFDATLKQNTKNTPWQVDMEDITGTTITVGATLVKKT